jgi:hypothetical protein
LENLNQQYQIEIGKQVVELRNRASEIDRLKAALNALENYLKTS